MKQAAKIVATEGESLSHYRRAAQLVNAGREREAAECLDAALRADPTFAPALSLGAYILARAGKDETALRFYQRALELRPDLTSAWSNLGKLLIKLKRHDAALKALNDGLRHAPDDPDMHNSRAGALRALGRLEDSAAAARVALRLRPNFPEAALNLGAAMLKLGGADQALSSFRRARAARPGYGDAYCGEALALKALGRFDEARAAFATAEALGSREAISGKGCLDLLMGDFARGWDGYEARWISGKSIYDALGRRFPIWPGPRGGRERVLVLNDHGIGDTFQFVRYLPLMAEAGIEAVFDCPPHLRRLMRGSSIPTLTDERTPADGFDAQIAISSLPRAFAARLETIPAPIPYLRAEPDLIAFWAKVVGSAGFKVGVVWQGNPNPEADMARSFPLAELAPLAAVPGVLIHSLQKGHGAEQLAHARFPIERLGPEFDAGPDAFIDTAAIMSRLDLIVTCDTSIAHLAGALGRPVWVALKRDAEWRWLLERDDSPWYPTMRLFRQKRDGDWKGVFAAMAAPLAQGVQSGMP